MALPINTAFTNLITVIGQPWIQGANDWINGAYGVLGATYTPTAFRVALAAALAVGDAAQTFLVANSASATQQAVPRAQADSLYASFPILTRLAFFQAAAPTGWTLDNTLNDKLVRIDSTAGGATGGGWSITGLTTTIAGTVLTVDQIPAHTHTVGGDATAPAISNRAGQTNTFNNNNITTNSTGGGLSHGHAGSTTTGDGAWRPAYVNAIICAKNS